MTNLWVDVVDTLNGILYASELDITLNLLPVEDGVMLLNRLQVCLARELLSRDCITLGREVIEYQVVDITIRRRQC